MRRVFFSSTTIAVLLWVFCAQAWAAQSESRTETRWQSNTREMISRTVDPAVPSSEFTFTDRAPGRGNPLDATGSVLWPTSDPTGMMNNLAVSDDGSLAAIFVDLNNMRLQVYNGQTGAVIYEIPAGPDMYGSVAVAGDASHVVYSTSTFLALLPPDNSTPVWTSNPGPGAAIIKVAISRDGQHILALEGATRLNQDSIHVWAYTPASNIPVWVRAYDSDALGGFQGATYSADGSTLVITGRQRFYVVNPVNGNLVWDAPAFNTEHPCGVSGDGHVISIGSNNDGKIRVYHWNPAQQTYILFWTYTFTGGSSNWGTATAVSANGETVAGGSLQFIGAGYAGYLAVFDTYAGGVPMWEPVNMADLVSDVNVSDDGLTITACSWGVLEGAGPADIQVFDKYDGIPFFTYEHPGSPNDLALTPDGTRLLVGGKSVHNRFFGNGGNAYMMALDLEGGTVTGTVTLQGTGDYSGVTLATATGVRHTMTDAAGAYQLQHIPAGTHTIVAGKLGYTTEQVPNVVITDGAVIPNVNFALDTAGPAPSNLTATNNLIDHVQLSWNPVTLQGRTRRAHEIAQAFGDEPVIGSRGPLNTVALNQERVTGNPWENTRGLHLDDLDDADSIHVWRGTIAGGPYTLIASVDGDLTTFSDSVRVFPTFDYYYVISAIYGIGESHYSNEIVGALDGSYLVYAPVVPPSTHTVTFDGILTPGEWDDAVRVDASDVFGYDGPEDPGTAIFHMKFDDATDMLYIATEDHANAALDDGEGFSIYTDDNNDDVWSYENVGTEGNYWCFWHASGPTMQYRSLSGGEYASNYYNFVNPQLAFSASAGYVTGEGAIPLGFHEPYELELHGPNRAPGIGIYINDQTTGIRLFHGWWPQNIPNIVSNPDYYGAPSIAADLYVPPQYPSNITAVREGTGIHVTWDDPTNGIDNLPLTHPLDGINLYRNGEFMDVIAPGTESWLDNAVEFGGWYEYSLSGFIPEGTESFEGPKSPALGLFAGDQPITEDIYYDDGNPEVFQIPAYPYDGNREAVRFERPSWANRVYTVSIFGNTIGLAGLGVAANDAGNGAPGTQLIGPLWFEMPAVLEYVTFHFPGVDAPFVHEDSFFVTMDWQADDVWNPGLGADQTQPIDQSSFLFTNTGGWQLMTVQDWMIRTSVGDTPDAVGPSDPGVAHEFRLMNNYPNPFNPGTTIPFELATDGEASLKIYNLLGQEVATLISGQQVAGYHVVPWTGKNNQGLSVPSGVYVVRLVSNEQTASLKIALIR